MPTASIRGIVRDLPPTRSIIAYAGILLQQEKTPTDFLFYTNLKLVSLLDAFSYAVYDKNNTLVTSGTSTGTDYFNNVSAFTVTDPISVYFLKYGYQYKKPSFVLTPVETLLFMSHDVNSNVTLNEADALALSGIAVDKANKTVTISVARSQSEIYDYLQAYQAQIANVDTLFDGEIFNTILGNTFNIASGWSFIFSAAHSGVFNITGNVEFSAQFDTADFNLSGTLTFSSDNTLTILDSSIDSVDTKVGTETVVINTTGSTVIPNNLDAVNITINAPQPTLTISNIVVGSKLVLHDLDNVDPQNKGTELLRNNNVIEDVPYVGTAGNLISISVYEAGYRNFYSEYTVSSSDANFTVNQQIETN